MKIGSQNIQKLYSGSQEIVKAYLGRDVIYENTPPTPPGPSGNGVYILYTDGSVSAYDTLVSGKTPVGPLLITNNVSLVIHPSAGYSKQWSSDTSTVISGVTTTPDGNIAKADYAGAANTAAVIASGLAGSAFTFATTDCVYADGRTGYLPSYGEMEEIRLNETNINTALGLIGGTALVFSSQSYWSSTQRNKVKAWCWYSDSSGWFSYIKDNNYYCRSVSTYSVG